MTTYPLSPAIHAVPSEDLLARIADEALNAFFAHVARSLDGLYPDGHTYGDVDPLEYMQRERIARQWLDSMAINHPTICAANEEN